MFKLTKTRRNALIGYSFIAIWIVGFALFMLYPLINSIIYSFSNVSITAEGIKITFVGLENFKNIFIVEQGFEFLEALGEFAQQLVLQVPIIVVFSIMIAILLNQKIKLRGFFRVVFFLPVIISSGPVINELLSQGAGGSNFIETYGFVSLIENSSLPGILADPLVALFKQIIIVFWFSGVQILILIAGLQKINTSVYEAAEIDGAGPWEIFWKVTLPSLKSLILINVVYTIVTLATFSENVVVAKIKANMFSVITGYGFASAISWIYLIVVLLFLGLCLLILNIRGKDRRA